MTALPPIEDSSSPPGAVIREDAVAWMAEVVGYSSMAERSSPESLYETLVPLFRVMSEGMAGAGGTRKI